MTLKFKWLGLILHMDGKKQTNEEKKYIQDGLHTHVAYC